MPRLIGIHSKSFIYTCVLPGIIRHRQVSIFDVIAGSGGFPFSHLKSALNKMGYFPVFPLHLSYHFMPWV